jgi:hypothetical protein
VRGVGTGCWWLPLTQLLAGLHAQCVLYVRVRPLWRWAAQAKLLIAVACAERLVSVCRLWFCCCCHRSGSGWKLRRKRSGRSWRVCLVHCTGCTSSRPWVVTVPCSASNEPASLHSATAWHTCNPYSTGISTQEHSQKKLHKAPVTRCSLQHHSLHSLQSC